MKSATQAVIAHLISGFNCALALQLKTRTMHTPNRLLFKSKADTPTQLRIRITVPRSYHQEPVISQLTYLYGLLVNITGAMLSSQTGGEGWFDLELRGSSQQIASGLAYLEQLDIKIAGKPNPGGDGWR